jgi:ferredoxin
MKLSVDMDLCQGHAACVQEAPALFALDPATNQVVIKQPSPDESQRADAKRAVRYCPTRALKLEG